MLPISMQSFTFGCKQNSELSELTPVEYGGMGLSYKYHAAVLEELGSINMCGVSSSVSVHTDVIVPPVAM